MGTTEGHRHPEPLGRADDDVGAELTRGSGEHTGEQIDDDDHDRASCVSLLYRGPPVGHRTCGGGQAEQDPEAGLVDVVGVADHYLEAQRRGAGVEHVDRLSVGVVVDEEAVAAPRGRAVGHRHCLGGSRCLVEERGVGDLEAGELSHHRLEVDQGFEPSLADLWLVGRVRRVPGGVLEHIAQDHGGHCVCRSNPGR